MWMLGCLEIVEYSFKEVYYDDMFTPGTYHTYVCEMNWCVPIILLSIRYNMCACRNPICRCLSGTMCILVIFQNITTLLLLLCTWYTVS